MEVILYANGMVVVFDRYGQQMPELQGRYDEVKDKIRAVYQGPWCFGVWRRWMHDGIPYDAIEFTVQQLKSCWCEDRAEPPTQE